MSEVAVEIQPARKPKMRLSASRISTWMTCQQQAKFKYVDLLEEPQNAAATFGSAVHKALEIYNLEGFNVQQAIEVFKDYWTYPEKYNKAPVIWPKQSSFGGYMQKGIAAINNYHEQMRWGKREVLAVEHPFLVPFGDFELHGFIDLLEFCKDKKGRDVVRITDFKTNGRAPYVNALRINIQFTIYDYASRQPEFWYGANEQYPGIPNGEWIWETRAKDSARENIWYGLQQKRAYNAGERDEADYLRLHRVAAAIEKALDNEVYVPNISGDSCTFCPFTGPCKLPFHPETDD